MSNPKTILELGVGTVPEYLPEVAYYHDIRESSVPLDFVWDLNNLPWPWQDESLQQIAAFDVVEHLKIDVYEWLNEAWRILKPDGSLVIRVPRYDSENFASDPTHRQQFAIKSFNFWIPGEYEHERYGKHYYGEYNRWWSKSRAEYNPSDTNLYFTLVKRI